jgi:enoyl-CoA hydratase
MVLTLTRRDELSVITLNRPEALNALNAQMIDAISAAIDDAAKAGTRALLFTGAGPKAFCAGADIKELLGRAVIES